jgi:acyl-CoA synthetase (AMP-forming)/AMP-acid ligase II
MGLVACFVLALCRHLHLVMEDPLDWVVAPASMLRAITAHGCTLAWVPNFALAFLAHRVAPEDRAGLDLKTLRALVNCSEPVSAASVDAFLRTYEPCGLRREAIATSYAMAENVFAVTQSPLGTAPPRVWVDPEVLGRTGRVVAVPAGTDGARCFVSSGPCLAGNAVRIWDDTGAVPSTSGVGEIHVRSDSLFAGYENRPDLTAAAFQDGWYKTGDVGFVQGDDLYVIGRKTDMIIVAGRNIWPEDVEAIAGAHPSIHSGRAVAIGMYAPDIGTEEIVVAAEVETDDVLARPGPTQLAIRQAITTELGTSVRGVFLKPRGWIVKSTAGKPARRETRAKLLREHPELGDGAP